MIVFFVGASTAFAKDAPTYRLIVDAIELAGHRPALQLDEASLIEAMGHNTLDKDDWEILSARELKTLHESDVAIFDATDKATFGVGYLAAVALQLAKPTLFLLRQGSLEGSIITGLKHPLLTRHYFDDDNVREVIDDFLESALTK